MFDYQAGEKYKLTLIMVGIAGLIAGMFFTLLLMPSPEQPQSRKGRGGGMSARVASNPDITGGRSSDGGFGSSAQGQQQEFGQPGATPAPGVVLVDRSQAQMFMNSWLPRVWDLSAASAVANQTEAMRYMTPDCAAAYQRNIWTPELAKQVHESGLQSSFQIKDINVSENLSDGSVVIKVKGSQTLGVPGKSGRTRDVNLEYMMKQMPDGMKIAGISEAGQNR